MDKPKLDLDIIIQRIVLILFSAGILALIIFAGLSIFFLSPVDRHYEGYVEFRVEEGWSRAQIADELAEEGLIRSSFFFKIFMLINNRNLYAGTFRLSQSMSVYDIIRTLNSTPSLEIGTINVTFIEGRRLVDHVRVIANNFAKDEYEIFERLADQYFLEELIERYWFLTNDILNEELKHPLEGYLFPATYNFWLEASIDDIIHRMLSTMEARLEIFRIDIERSTFSIHELLTMASIIELEVPRALDRNKVARLIFNRLDRGITLGMDVTTHYAVGTELRDELTMAQINTCSPFNTRGICAVPGLPVGPIASPSLTSITAVIEPHEDDEDEIFDHIFFVTDRHLVVHYSRTYEEHRRIIRQLIEDGDWYQFGR